MVNEKILELMKLDNRYAVATEEKKAADAKADEARKAYNSFLEHLIDSDTVIVNQMYMIDGSAVIFRKKKKRDEHDSSHPYYDYSYEVLPVV